MSAEADAALAEAGAVSAGGRRLGRGATAAAMLLAWAVPGGGHVALGRWRRGLMQGGLVVFMFCFGLWIGGSLSRPEAGSWLSILATVADLGVGPAYFVVDGLGLGAGVPELATNEIGNAFHWSAGILNLILVLDVADIGAGRK